MNSGYICASKIFPLKEKFNPIFPTLTPILDHLSSDPDLNPTAKLLYLRLYQLAAAAPSTFTLNTYTATLAHALGKTTNTISTEIANLTRLGYLIPLGNARANGSTCVAVRFPQRHLPELLSHPTRQDKQHLALFTDASARPELSCSLGAFRFIQDTKRFTLIPHAFLNDLFQHKPLSSTAKLLFLVLYRHAYFHPEHQTTLSRAQLATVIARTPKTISRAIQELIEHHYIHKTPSEPCKTQQKNLNVLYIPFSQRNPNPPERLRLSVHIPPSVADIFKPRENISAAFASQLEPKQHAVGKMAVSRLQPQNSSHPHPAGQGTPLPMCSTCSCALPVNHMREEGCHGIEVIHKPQHPSSTPPLAEDLKSLAEEALEELSGLLPEVTSQPGEGQGEAPETQNPEPPLKEMSLSGEAERDKNRNYIYVANKNKKINLTRDLRDLCEAERSKLFQAVCRSFFQMKQTAKHTSLSPSEALQAAFEQVPSEHKRFVARLPDALQSSYVYARNPEALELDLALAENYAQGHNTAETYAASGRVNLFQSVFFSPFMVEEENAEHRAAYEARQTVERTASPPTTPTHASTPRLTLTAAQAHRAALRLNAQRTRFDHSGTSAKELLVQFLYHIATWNPTQIVCRDTEHRIEIAMQVGLKMLREGRWRAPYALSMRKSLELETAAASTKRQELAELNASRQVA